MSFFKKNKYIKYSRAELERYVTDKVSCIGKIHTTEHIGIPLFGLANLKETIARLLDRKVGRFNRNLNGIVLDIRNTKVLDMPSIIRYDSSELHLNIELDFYVFQPKIGVVVPGIVKHISQQYIGVIIYRVFNVAVKFTRKKGKKKVQINQEIKIRVLSFNLESNLPEIDGELVTESVNGDTHESEETVDEKVLNVKNEKPRDSESSSIGSDVQSPESLSKRRSILIKREKQSSSPKQTPKRVSFMAEPKSSPAKRRISTERVLEQIPLISIKQEKDTQQPTVSSTQKKKKSGSLLKQEKNNQKSVEHESGSLKQRTEKDFETMLSSSSVEQEKNLELNNNKKGKKRKDHSDPESRLVEINGPLLKKRKLNQNPDSDASFTNQEDTDAPLRVKVKKEKREKDKRASNVFDDTLVSILSEVEESFNTSRNHKHKKNPKIKHEPDV